ncbi:MAG: HD domain-containing protein [Gammaproteobacteria bacterium]
MTNRYGTRSLVQALWLLGLLGALANSANAVRAEASGRSSPGGAPAAAQAPASAGTGAADWHATVRELAAKHFKNPAWGYSHNMRDYSLARELAAADHVTLDDDVLFAAAYLHDLAAFPPWEKEKLDHSDVAADSVDTILTGTGFPMSKIDAVRGAIRTHMYYRDPVGPEALYLHDADALDWLGAIGVARIFGLVDPNGGDPNGPKAVKMLEDNLKNTPSRVLSPAGRALVPARKAELEAFLKELRHETENLKTL